MKSHDSVEQQTEHERKVWSTYNHRELSDLLPQGKNSNPEVITDSLKLARVANLTRWRESCVQIKMLYKTKV